MHLVRFTLLLIIAVICFPQIAMSQWQSGETSMTRAPESVRQAILNNRIDHNFSEFRPPPVSDTREPLPTVFNWHDSNGADFMSPVRDQGSCGSCWTFGSLGAMEGAINIYLNNPNFDYDLSEQFMVSCGAGSCASGGFAEEVLAELRIRGIPDEACYPYIAQEGYCDDACDDWEERVVRIYDWGVWLAPTVDQLKRELLNGPMPVTMRVENSLYGYRGGVYVGDSSPCDIFTSPVNHVVTLVGWNDNNNTWIVRNSWGEDWGENGYFNIRRGTSCLGNFSANWLRVDPTTVPGNTAEAKLCIAPDSFEFDVPRGTRANPVTTTLTNCGNIATPWSAKDSMIEHVLWADLSPFEGSLDVGESITLTLTPKTEDKQPCDYVKWVEVKPLMAGTSDWIRMHFLISETPTDGDITDGDVTDGDITDGDVTDGDVTDGDITDGDVTDGDVTDGDVTDGDVTDGDVTDGDVTDGDVIDGDVTDGDVIDGDVSDGDSTDGDFIDGDATDGDSSDGDVTDGDFIDGDATDGDVIDGDDSPLPDGDVTDGDEQAYAPGGMDPASNCQQSQGTPFALLLIPFLFLLRRREVQ